MNNNYVIPISQYTLTDSWRSHVYINHDGCPADVSSSPDDTTYNLLDPYDETCWMPFSDTGTTHVIAKFSVTSIRQKHLVLTGHNISCHPLDGITVISGKGELCTVHPYTVTVNQSSGLTTCTFLCENWEDTYILFIRFRNENQQSWKLCSVWI